MFLRAMMYQLCSLLFWLLILLVKMVFVILDKKLYFCIQINN
jgi:hypothetical protein